MAMKQWSMMAILVTEHAITLTKKTSTLFHPPVLTEPFLLPSFSSSFPKPTVTSSDLLFNSSSTPPTYSVKGSRGSSYGKRTTSPYLGKSTWVGGQCCPTQFSVYSSHTYNSDSHLDRVNMCCTMVKDRDGCLDDRGMLCGDMRRGDEILGLIISTQPKTPEIQPNPVELQREPTAPVKEHKPAAPAAEQNSPRVPRP
ncbi:hypothetical protein K435DRAFT_869331 [Dendrothele bispora CBS 962.96]|uniref:Uncharacterized protein n=1 Tax=Dendrothele bispora (strain CBS 962.96) TaxID=1314807 RepID=A0A4S8L9E1_DENBC|nr:hypothetical protein K435DRAFT_869331 [Dendrothele bispora CBS 962.96]